MILSFATSKDQAARLAEKCALRFSMRVAFLRNEWRPRWKLRKLWAMFSSEINIKQTQSDTLFIFRLKTLMINRSTSRFQSILNNSQGLVFKFRGDALSPLEGVVHCQLIVQSICPFRTFDCQHVFTVYENIGSASHTSNIDPRSYLDHHAYTNLGWTWMLLIRSCRQSFKT